MKTIVAFFASLALLAGCSSSTKLSETTTAQAAAPIVSSSSVAPVEVSQSKASTEGPKQTAHVVYFDYDSFSIKGEARPIIEKHAQYLRANPQRKLQLEGHTDHRGGREYNIALGQKRAEAVQRTLTLLGASAAQIESISFGKEKPAALDDNEASWAKNRRAEFVYR